MTKTVMPPLAVSIGEPAGVGPEIICKAWTAHRGRIPFFVIGDPAHVSAQGVPVAEIAAPRDADEVIADALPVLPLAFPGAAQPGCPVPEQAPMVVEAIAIGAQLAMDGAAAGLVTAPIHKKALQDGAGFAFPGHTEFLAEVAGVSRVVMMLACPALRVVPTTIHIPLAEVPAALTQDLLRETIAITVAGLKRDFGIPAPRVAVTGLNPHAGEGGAMGHEDATVIAPVLAEMVAQGLSITGPWPADTLFHAGARAGYDVVIAMYHDQALIPIKTLDFAGGVNVTLGLPFVRTSPDHGTAFDIAGKGLADPTSLLAAMDLAWEMANARASGAAGASEG